MGPQENPFGKDLGPYTKSTDFRVKQKTSETHLVQAIYFGATHVTPFRRIGDGTPILWGFLG